MSMTSAFLELAKLLIISALAFLAMAAAAAEDMYP